MRDEVSHRFIDDDMDGTKSIGLCPSARLLHRSIMRTFLPRTGTYDQVYTENFRALYAIYGDVQVNWIQLIMDEFIGLNQGNMKHIYYGEYIMWLLKNARVPEPDSDVTSMKFLNARTISLMKLPPRPLRIMSFEEWKQRAQSRQQTTSNTSSSFSSFR